MTKATCVLGFLTCFLVSTGVMFELFHWPYSGKIMFSGFLLLNFGFLPVFFYQKYKSVSV
jgi:hypothetical protein